MAAGGGPLPVPAPAGPALFARLFGDPSLDPQQGRYEHLLADFAIDLNNAGNNTSPQDVRSQLAAAGNLRHPLALGLLIDGKVNLYFLPFKWERAAGAAPNPALDNKLFAFEGELVNNQGYLVELLVELFHQIANQVHVAVVDHIKTELAGDPTPNFMMGPFTKPTPRW